MDRKGFTLVELLGVIVIVGALALTVSVVVTSTLKNSKSKLTDIQIKNIEKAAKAYYLKEGIVPQSENYSDCVSVEYLIENDYIEASEIKNPIDNDEMLGSVKITYDSKKYKYTYQEDGCKVCELVSGGANTIGSKYGCEVKPGTKYNFFVLSQESNGTTNLIMERNICEDGTVATAEKRCTVAWNEDNTASYDGPVTAMKYLNNATTTWDNIPNLNITYDDEGGNYTSFKITGKARLPYLSEVEDYNGSNGYLYENLSSEDWGYKDGQPSNNIENIYGYWTLSTDYYFYPWSMHHNGEVDAYYGVNVGDIYGVRPVINVKL